MYGLPHNTDLNFFVGKTLLQVCFGEHDLLLNFDGPISVSITSAVGLILPEGAKHKWEDFRQGAGFLVALTNQTVSLAKGSIDGTLTLVFQEGGTLEIYDNSKQYESYVIKNGDKLIVV